MKRLAFTIFSAGAACVLIAASTANQPSSAPSRPAPVPPALSFDKVLYVSTGTLKHADKPSPSSSNAPATTVSAAQSAANPAPPPPPQKRRKRGPATLRYLDLDGDGVADSRDL
jgi:hypothetical protein